MEKLYYYQEKENAAVVWTPAHRTAVLYQCHRYDDLHEHVHFTKHIIDLDTSAMEADGWQLCDKEQFEKVLKDFFCKVKEIRNLFESLQLNPRYW